MRANRRAQTSINLRRQRKGSVLVFTAMMMVVMMGLLALAVDVGYLENARCQLQKSADAAALAAAAELIDDEALTGTASMSDEISSARAMAIQFAAANTVCSTAPVVDANTGNNTSGDVVVGYIADLSNSHSSMSTTNQDLFNSVQVRVRRNTIRNGDVPHFFAKVLGVNGTGVEGTATAAIMKNIKGFQIPDDGSNLGLLPFALDKQTWDGLLAGGGTDSWTWDEATDTLRSGGDGVREVNLFPQATGSSGNRGTVDIGPSNNSTSDIARQILHGVNQADLDAIGGKIEFDANGQLFLNGDTGISAGVKDELAAIRGQPRTIPIFSAVNGPGNNAQYTIVAFAGVRIMEVKLTGSQSTKKVIIQPAKVVSRGAIPNDGATSSYFVYSPVWLVR